MIADLSRCAYEYRPQVLRMVYQGKTGHLGGAFSAAEILTTLYFHQLRLDPENPSWEDRDRLVFRRGTRVPCCRRIAVIFRWTSYLRFAR
jgi:transketolase